MAGDLSPYGTSERAMFAAPAPAPATLLPVPATSDPALPALRPGRWPALRRLGAGLSPRRAVPVSAAWLARKLPEALATEADRGVGFIFIPVFLAIGAIAYFSLPGEPGLTALAAASVGLSAAAFLARERRGLYLALLAALLLALGMLVAKIETLRAGTKVLGSEITTRLTGNVVEIEHLASGRVRLTIDVTATERPALRYAPDRVRVSARKIPEDVEAGSSITGLVRLMPPSGPVRPASYDFSFNSYFDGIGASGFFMQGPERAAQPGAATLGATLRASIERGRNAVAERIRSRISGPEGEIAAALVVGIRAGIPDDVNEALRRAGLYHVISISGLHMALVAATIMGLMRGAFALFPDFSSRRPVKKFAAGAALAGLAAYLFFSGADVAAQRSFIMLAVMLTALLFDRAALTMRNLAISAIVVIVVSPHEAAGPSFQMSFAATAALVGAYAGWSDYRLNRPGGAPPRRSFFRSAFRKLVVFAAGLAATSLIAGGATSIFSAFHFQQVSSTGLLANLAAMPIVSAVVMPFAVLGALTIPFGIDGFFFAVMGEGLTATIAIARWFSERSPLDTVGLVPPLAVIALTVALLIATACTTWLRAAALPIALAGILILPHHPVPDLLISEDARLVGLAQGDGRLAVNRSRPNEFTVENWQRAMQADEIVRPESRFAPEDLAGEGAGLSQDAPRQDGWPPPFASADPPSSAAGFTCAEGLCLARHPSGAVVAQAQDAVAASRACALAAIIVVDDATAEDVCPGAGTPVVTKRDLARRGSAQVTFTVQEPAGDAANANRRAKRHSASISFAVPEPYRPWHMQRFFSREARGLPPYQRKSAASRPQP